MAKTTPRIAPNGNVPLQYLPYKPGSITTMNLNNSSKLFTTAELSGCGLLIEQGKKNHFRGTYSRRRFKQFYGENCTGNRFQVVQLSQLR